MNTLQAFESLSPLATMSKGSIKELGQQQANEIIESGSAANDYAIFHKFETLIKEVKNGIKKKAIEEVKGGYNSAFGVNMRYQEKSDYKYDHDPNWVKLKNALEEYQELMKAKLYKTLSFAPLDEKSGELIDVLPAKRSGSESIVTKF